MTVGQAKAAARRWVAREAEGAPGFGGAFFHGSANWLPDDAALPETSDIDVMVVSDSPTEEPPPEKRGKFRFDGALLEVSYVAGEQIRTPEQVLANYPLAGSFRDVGVISDPTGHLGRLGAAVGRDYARRRWVRARCDHARGNVLHHLAGLKASAPFHEQVPAWWFGAGVTTHVLLVAGLENPTVRRRYEAARALLANYGLSDFYEELLALLGCADMTRERAEQHLAAVAAAFDAASGALKTPYRFSADLSADARPVAVDGSRELIESGHHREAVFWLVATYSRCQWVLHHDAPPETREPFDRGYRLLMADLGVQSFADLARRADDVRAFLPRVRDMAEAIMAANPEIQPSPPAPLPPR